jgi:hypothetical protein
LPEGLGWPPKKEDLERLYLAQKLSAAKIADLYGLAHKYRTPKVAESTVLYQLKKNGIGRRDRAEHIRKVTHEMVDEWVKMYQAGQSLKEIAGEAVDPVTVWNHLKARGVVLRDKVDAQIQAVTKHQRKRFSGDKIEKAYLMGLRYGDLHVVRHGRAIRVRVSTTHPAMADLFESVFSPYGHVHRYPREAKLVGYEWTLECDLDDSFEFLLPKPSVSQLEALSTGEMIAFLAGVFDAEGSIILHRKRGRYNPEAVISNTDRTILNFVSRGIKTLGLHSKLMWMIQAENRAGITGLSVKGQVIVWRFRDVQKLLQTIPIKHEEKVAKAGLVGMLEYRGPPSGNMELAKSWEGLNSRIKAQRNEFVQLAANLVQAKTRG